MDMDDIRIRLTADFDDLEGMEGKATHWFAYFVEDAGDEPEKDPFGYISMWSVDTMHLQQVFLYLDDLDADLGHLMGQVLTLEGKAWVTGERLLLIDRIELEDEYRGKGLAAKLLDRALRVAGVGHTRAYLDATPVFDRTAFPNERAERSFELTTSRKLRALWATIGFQSEPMSRDESFMVKDLETA